MIEEELAYFAWCRERGLVRGRVLEVGAGPGGQHPRLFELARSWGLESVGADIEKHDGLLTVDFSLPARDFSATWTGGTFDTVCAFNVLEHVFDPVTVFANLVACASPACTILVTTPAVWRVHRYPVDCSRLLPDWYRACAERFGFALPADAFVWMSGFGRVPIAEHPPLPNFRDSDPGSFRTLRSRVVHRLLNTYGRNHVFTWTSIGAAFVRGT